MKRIISLIIRYVPRKYLQRISGLALQMLALVYRGNNVHCPICGKHFRKFLPYGRIRPRENALCPGCQSLERHRLIWLYLQERSDVFKRKMKILHIAPEACYIKPFEKMHGDGYITADIESPLAKVRMDIHKIPFPENTFDLVLCNHVLEHVENDIVAMQEIERVMRPHGFAILQVPFFHPLPETTFEDSSITDRKAREKVFGQDDHVRKYGKDYLVRIEKAGLIAVEDAYIKTLTPEQIFRHGLSKEEMIYKGVKA
jgi:SAM-dependent methyltransferase